MENIDGKRNFFDKQPGTKVGQAQIKLEFMVELARAGGVPAVGVQAVDCWQWRSGHYNHNTNK